MRRVVLLLVLAVFTAGCASSITGTANPVGPAGVTADERFVADIRDTPGLTSTMTDAEMVVIGRSTCDAIGVPGITRENLEAAAAGTKFGPQVATVFIDAAERNLCPEKRYSAAPPVHTSPTRVVIEAQMETYLEAVRQLYRSDPTYGSLYDTTLDEQMRNNFMVTGRRMCAAMAAGVAPDMAYSAAFPLVAEAGNVGSLEVRERPDRSGHSLPRPLNRATAEHGARSLTDHSDTFSTTTVH